MLGGRPTQRPALGDECLACDQETARRLGLGRGASWVWAKGPMAWTASHSTWSPPKGGLLCF